jgi:hypothetical protein
MPHWTPAVQQSVYFRDGARGPFPIDNTVVNPTPETVFVTSLPERNKLVASAPDEIDETLGLAPVVSPDSVRRPSVAAQLIPNTSASSRGAAVVMPASVPLPPKAQAPAIDQSPEPTPPVMTSDVSLDQPAKSSRPKSTGPRQLPGAEFGTGTVTSVRIKDGMALIAFNTEGSLPAGSVVRAYHQYALIAKKAVCDLQVVESENGKAVVVAYGSSQLSDLSVGDRAVVLQ